MSNERYNFHPESGPRVDLPINEWRPLGEIDTDGAEIHRVYVEEDEQGHESWECTTCCSGGQTSFASPTAFVLAQQSHDRRGDNIKVVETHRRPE